MPKRSPLTISVAGTVRDGILEAWAFAVFDPYRAATHNKGIMNGIDAVVLATGNDWRAIEAGAHAYATRGGSYTSLSQWHKDENGNLHGKLTLPMAVGIVGGATRVHPTAQANLKLMGVSSAAELGEIIVSVGLAQNLAAIRALATEGIQRGHMSLHARQIALTAGATAIQAQSVADQMVGKMLSTPNAQSQRNEERLRPASTQSAITIIFTNRQTRGHHPDMAPMCPVTACPPKRWHVFGAAKGQPADYRKSWQARTRTWLPCPSRLPATLKRAEIDASQLRAVWVGNESRYAVRQWHDRRRSHRRAAPFRLATGIRLQRRH